GLERADGKRVIGFEDLYLRFDPLGSLLDRGLTLARLRLDRPLVAVELMPDKALDLAALIRVDTTVAVDTSGGAALHTHDLEITGGSVSFTDRGRQPELEMNTRAVDLRLAHFRTRRGANN